MRLDELEPWKMIRTTFRVKGELKALCQNRKLSDGSPVSAWLQRFNANISVNSMVTVPLYLVIRNATWFGLVTFFTAQALGGPELAVGYLTAKVTSKFRQPINVPIAALLKEMFPVLGHVKASSIFPIPKFEDINEDKNDSKFVQKVAYWTVAPLDKYGFAFYAASKATTFLTIGGTAMLIKQGVDISGPLEYLGVSRAVQDVGGAAGLASMVNVGLIPSHLLLLGHVAPRANILFQWVKFKSQR